jgi:hypothetical protein
MAAYASDGGRYLHIVAACPVEHTLNDENLGQI